MNDVNFNDTFNEITKLIGIIHDPDLQVALNEKLEWLKIYHLSMKGQKPSDCVSAHQVSPRQFLIELTDAITIVELDTTEYGRTVSESELIDCAGETTADECNEELETDSGSKEDEFWKEYNTFSQTRTFTVPSPGKILPII